jgi:hypothetical protein
LATLLVFSLSACASLTKGPSFTEAVAPNANEALVYLFRPYSFYSTLLETEVYFDGKSIASLGLNDHTWVRTTPGRHVVGVTQPFGQRAGSYPQPYEFMTNAGKTYVLTLERRQEGSVQVGMVHRWRLEENPGFDGGIRQSSYRGARASN